MQLIAGQGPGFTFAFIILYIMIKDKKDASIRDVALTDAIHKLAMEILALRMSLPARDDAQRNAYRTGQEGTR